MATMTMMAEAPQVLDPEDVNLVGAAINAVWREVAEEDEPAVDAAFTDLMVTLGGLLPRCWDRSRFNLICTEGIEV